MHGNPGSTYKYPYNVLTDATSVRFFLNYTYLEHRVILPGATKSKVPTESVLAECSYTVVICCVFLAVPFYFYTPEMLAYTCLHVRAGK